MRLTSIAKPASMKRLILPMAIPISLSSTPSIASRHWTARFDYRLQPDHYNDNQARVMAYDSATGNPPPGRWYPRFNAEDALHPRDLQGNVVVGGFYNELLTGVAYEITICCAPICCAVRTSKALTSIIRSTALSTPVIPSPPPTATSGSCRRAMPHTCRTRCT
ncbi:hypothetical protein BANRA_05299 [Klebsiella pneumoniae]|nr:hypothetical protein BANRA_05299 [Klebsiella pneumoniae]